MPGGRGNRGGRRQGTPGKSYSNRTDLATNYAPSTTATPAAGVFTSESPSTTPDMVPRLDDPSVRPMEPVTHGLPIGAGGGSEALGPVPPDPSMSDLRAAYLRNPTPQLARVLGIMAMKGVK